MAVFSMCFVRKEVVRSCDKGDRAARAIRLHSFADRGSSRTGRPRPSR